MEEKEIMRVHPKFKMRIEDFLVKFEEIKGVKISTKTATRILDEKIEKQGGLKV